ncbi:ER membrane protein complex subunit 2-like [Pectinophora gossypiella]|nr:ER membrane protein complex subunit 2-like [Pectinophora gossypiella]
MSYSDSTSRSEARELLRKWRESNERRSEEVIDLWSSELGEYYFVNVNAFGNDKYVLLEQVIFAALDCHQYSIADFCINILNDEFPDSLRVRRYRAARLEAEEKYDEALEILDSIIKADETNAPARKRRIAIAKALGLIPEAIKELVDYLKKFMSDVEAWQELCELYIGVGEYARAAFCAEELILHQPHNHLMHQRLADIRYTMGGVENMELAKSYYSQALKLNPDNMRALLGLFLVTTNLLSHYKSSGNSAKRKEAWKLCQRAQAACVAGANAAPASALSLSHAMLALAITD